MIEKTLTISLEEYNDLLEGQKEQTYFYLNTIGSHTHQKVITTDRALALIIDCIEKEFREKLTKLDELFENKFKNVMSKENLLYTKFREIDDIMTSVKLSSATLESSRIKNMSFFQLIKWWLS